jgi:hypothetical protein
MEYLFQIYLVDEDGDFILPQDNLLQDFPQISEDNLIECQEAYANFGNKTFFNKTIFGLKSFS